MSLQAQLHGLDQLDQFYTLPTDSDIYEGKY